MCSKLIIVSFALGGFFGVVAQQDNHSVPLKEIHISIYPNPASEYLYVDFDYSINKAEFELNSMIGNKIKITPDMVSEGKYRIPLDNLCSGYYFLIVKHEAMRFKKALKFLIN